MTRIHHRGTKRKSAAFTLIEVLMVVVIVGMSAAIIVPQIASRDDLKAASCARMVMADLMFAQNKAIVTQAPVYVKFDSTSQKYSILSNYSSGTIVTNPQTMLPYTQQLGSSASSMMNGMKLNSFSFDGKQTIGFDALGTPLAVDSTGSTATMSSGSIVVGAGSNSVTVTVQPYTGELSAQ